MGQAGQVSVSSGARRGKAFLLGFTLAIALVNCNSGPIAPDSYTVSGTVTRDGEPAADVLVTATPSDPSFAPQTAVTDASGTYQMHLALGDRGANVDVTIEPPPESDCTPSSQTVELGYVDENGGFYIGTGTADFECTSRRAAQVTIEPEAVSVLEHKDHAVDFVAIVRAATGEELTSRQVAWELVTVAPGVTVGVDGAFSLTNLVVEGEYPIRARVDGVEDTGVIEVVGVDADLYYTTLVEGIRQVFRDRLDDVAPPAQLWTNTGGNILHLAANQVTGIVYFAQGIGNGADIIAMSPDGQTRTNLTNSPANVNQTPAVNPLTGQIYFSRAAGGSQDIYVMNADGTSVQRITPPGGGGKLYPAVSPDGSQLAWAQDVGGGNYEIFTSSITGANPVQFTNSTGRDIAPYWVSNNLIAWTRDVSAGNAEAMMAEWPTGANQRIITIDDGVSYPGNDGQPGQSCLHDAVLITTNRTGKNMAAILDTGIDAQHPDLRAWMNVAEADGDIGSAAMRCR